MSGLCFSAYSVSSGAKSTAWLHIRNEPDPLFLQVLDKHCFKKGQDAERSSLSSVDILQIFIH